MSYPGRVANTVYHHVDATNQIVGRLSAMVAQLIKGKHKPTFQANRASGDVVIITNADQVKFSGKKWDQKLYRWHTGYPGGLRERTAKDQLQKQPTKILRHSILGMLTRNKLRHGYQEKNLWIFPGTDVPEDLKKRIEGKEPLQRVPRARNGQFHFGLYKENFVVEKEYE